MNDSNIPVIVDGFEDVCSCDSVYHSFVNTLGGTQLPAPVPTPTSAISVTKDAPESDFLSSKDQRDFEHSRQQMKKPRDILKGKRCARCGCCRPWKYNGSSGRVRTAARERRSSITAAIAERRVEPSMDGSVDMSEDLNYVAPAAPRTVSLADLVKQPPKGSDKRFEMVQRPRQVLVLDDFTEIDSAKYEQPDDWEHVDFEGKARHKAPARTYARVVTMKA